MFPDSRPLKDLEGIQRPTDVVTGVMAHGWFTGVFLSSDLIVGGGDLFCELLCRSIGRVATLAKQKGVGMPQHLIVVIDNTVGWGKNQQGLRFMAWLVMLGHFTTATLVSLMCGHTHEDIVLPDA